jgi:hypothetical protein
MSIDDVCLFIYFCVIDVLWEHRGIYKSSYIIVEFTPPSFSFTPPPPFLE